MFPFYVLKNYNKYFNQNTDEDRIIFILWEIHKIFTSQFNKLSKSQLKKILTITFDEITSQTDETLKNIENFLKIKKSKYTKKVLKKEKCPRKLEYDLREFKRIKIEKKISNFNKKKLAVLINIYKSKTFIYKLTK